MQPAAYRRVAVIGMNEFEPPPARQALGGVAKIFDSPLVQVLQLAHSSAAPHECRDGVDEESKLSLTLDERYLGAFAVVIQAGILERNRRLRGQQLQHRDSRRREHARGQVVLRSEERRV